MIMQRFALKPEPKGVLKALLRNAFKTLLGFLKLKMRFRRILNLLLDILGRNGSIARLT
jgi:hypothetical protein